MSSFTARAVLALTSEQENGRESLEVVEPFEFGLDGPNDSTQVCIEKGFRTDLASVPFPFSMIIPPLGRYSKAAIVHDKLYALGQLHTKDGLIPIPRKMADDIFRKAMRVTGVPKWQEVVIYYGVRLGGKRPWKRYRNNEGA